MKIWIDLDNTPHVPFFKPIIRELEKRGHEVVLTARDAFQVCELADRMGAGMPACGTPLRQEPFHESIRPWMAEPAIAAIPVA